MSKKRTGPRAWRFLFRRRGLVCTRCHAVFGWDEVVQAALHLAYHARARRPRGPRAVQLGLPFAVDQVEP